MYRIPNITYSMMGCKNNYDYIGRKRNFYLLFYFINLFSNSSNYNG